MSTSSNDFAVRLVDAGKRYVKYDDVPTLVGWAKRFTSRKRRGHLWAVRHFDLEVAPGETVGIIGRNGAGKTTTLQMLAGITSPTEGTVAVRGRISPLIAVGVGFHAELTGRENVYVNGTILGMDRKDIDRHFDDIVAFAELDFFIDTPVKFYSSGMLVRLGFAVAIAARPDVLLVDEVLAVGDLPFQIKCHERISAIREAGTSVVVVSHNLTAVRQLCSRVVVMERGTPRFTGPATEGISVYHEILDNVQEVESGHGAAVKVISSSLLDAEGRPTVRMNAGDEVTVRMEAEFLEPQENAIFGVTVTTETGLVVYQDSTFLDERARYEAGDRVRCDIHFRADLPTGTYSVRGAIKWAQEEDAMRQGNLLLFYVDGRPFVVGTTDLKATFGLENGAAQVPSAASAVPSQPSWLEPARAQAQDEAGNGVREQ